MEEWMFFRSQDDFQYGKYGIPMLASLNDLPSIMKSNKYCYGSSGYTEAEFGYINGRHCVEVHFNVCDDEDALLTEMLHISEERIDGNIIGAFKIIDKGANGTFCYVDMGAFYNELPVSSDNRVKGLTEGFNFNALGACLARMIDISELAFENNDAFTITYDEKGATRYEGWASGNFRRVLTLV